MGYYLFLEYELHLEKLFRKGVMVFTLYAMMVEYLHMSTDKVAPGLQHASQNINFTLWSHRIHCHQILHARLFLNLSCDSLCILHLHNVFIAFKQLATITSGERNRHLALLDHAYMTTSSSCLKRYRFMLHQIAPFEFSLQNM